MKFFEKKKKPVYDMADQSFVASVLDALNLSHGDAVLEISKDSVLAESYFANRYGAYVKHLKTASELTGGFFELSVSTWFPTLKTCLKSQGKILNRSP